MSADEELFLSTIHREPRENLHRLVYADWLEEQGDPRATLLRLQVQLRNLPCEDPAYAELHQQFWALRQAVPDKSWLVRMLSPAWAVVANVVRERPWGPGGAEIRYGTKQFAPGAKVTFSDAYWGTGGERVTVVGRHRKSHRYITLTMSVASLEKWRTELIFSPTILAELRLTVNFLPDSAKARDAAEECAGRMNLLSEVYRGDADGPF